MSLAIHLISHMAFCLMAFYPGHFVQTLSSDTKDLTVFIAVCD